MHLKTIALTGANEAAMEAATHRLLATASAQGLHVNVLQGVKTACEASAVYMQHGELWRIGEDASAPELDALVDRAIDDSTPARLQHDVDQALQRFLSKTHIAGATV